jgi:hypothetical protein
MMRSRSRGPAVLGILLTLILTGCGGSSASATHARTTRHRAAIHGVLIAGASCQPRSAHHPRCTVLLTVGSRYRCALSASRHLSGTTIAANTHCVPLLSKRIPASWKPVLGRLADARICLRQHGLRVLGGASVAAVPPRNSPVGAVVVAGRPAGIVVTWYWTSRGAERAVRAYAGGRHAGHLARRGQVTVSWLYPKLLPRGRLAAVEGCAFV